MFRNWVAENTIESARPSGGPGQLSLLARVVVEVALPCKGRDVSGSREAPVGMPHFVRMLKQARTTLPSGMSNGTGMHTCPIPSGSFRQTLLLRESIEMHAARSSSSPPSNAETSDTVRKSLPSNGCRDASSVAETACSSNSWYSSFVPFDMVLPFATIVLR